MFNVRKGEKIFAQGDRADAVFVIQSGKVKITVVSATGKEGVITMLGTRDVFGEAALNAEGLRMHTATALEQSTVFRIERRAMTRALHQQGELAGKFISVLLTRKTDLEEDLCDQLFNHSEKRLARVLLKLVRLHEHNIVPDATIPLVSHEVLAEMVGTTRSRITYFMNKFRAQGLINYDKELNIKTEELTNVVLRD
jgi:CRP-like cAMP-binding protein